MWTQFSWIKINVVIIFFIIHDSVESKIIASSTFQQTKSSIDHRIPDIILKSSGWNESIDEIPGIKSLLNFMWSELVDDTAPLPAHHPHLKVYNYT